MLFLATILFACFVVALPILITYLVNLQYTRNKEWRELTEKFSKTKFPLENVYIIPFARVANKKLKYALKVAVDTDGVYFHVSKLFSALAIWFIPWSQIQNLSCQEQDKSIIFNVNSTTFVLFPVNSSELYQMLQNGYQNRVK
ncbi:MAG: hypothetical protein NZ455_00310 [Bacteroidia bacterium]|nr:hypothetical protein [Bacteroidia bacterium]MDW8346613.1 hypothetical protein [Bacteroidia bacterium]